MKQTEIFNKDFLNNINRDGIVVFKKPKGSIVIYNTHGVHRAKPSKDKSLIRKSLFFQVDKELEHSEPILVKTEYLEKFDERIKLYLGFGKNAGMNLEIIVNVVKILMKVVNNSHPKDISKSPALAGFFVFPTIVLTFQR